MSISSHRLVAAAAALVASAGLAAAPASAEDVRTVTVDYKDIDLHSVTGQQQLSRRIAYAAGRVCDDGGTDLRTRISVQACKVAAKAQARAEVEARNPGA